MLALPITGRNFAYASSGATNMPKEESTIEELKDRVRTAKTVIARWDIQICLVNMGDTNTIEQLMAEYSTYIGARRYLGEELARSCSQPLVIPTLAQHLQIEEPSLPGFTGGDARLPRLSVDVARIIRGIILKSSVFNADVKAWAESLSERDRDLLRESMRLWWKENGERIKQKDYEAVTPPTTAPTPSPTPSPMKN